VAITKQKKSEIVAKLKDIFAKSPAIAFVRFNRLTVVNAVLLRRKLREAGTGYYVAKKTLIRKSLEGEKISGTLPALEGEVAVAYLAKGDDVTAPAREVFSFGKQLEKAVELIGGIFDGRFIGQKEALALAAVPSRQTLLAQFANLVNSPIQRLVVGLDQIAKKKS
jgi:large subunit ribosomal protein L10